MAKLNVIHDGSFETGALGTELGEWLNDGDANTEVIEDATAPDGIYVCKISGGSNMIVYGIIQTFESAIPPLQLHYWYKTDSNSSYLYLCDDEDANCVYGSLPAVAEWTEELIDVSAVGNLTPFDIQFKNYTLGDLLYVDDVYVLGGAGKPGSSQLEVLTAALI